LIEEGVVGSTPMTKCFSNGSVLQKRSNPHPGKPSRSRKNMKELMNQQIRDVIRSVLKSGQSSKVEWEGSKKWHL
jgi:hypothetical protein